jgi:hypothetical protein
LGGIVCYLEDLVVWLHVLGDELSEVVMKSGGVILVDGLLAKQ